MTKQIVTKQIVAFFSASQCEAENSHIAKDVKEFSEGINSSFYQYDGCSTLKKFFSFGKVNAYGTGTQADAFMTKLIKFHDKHPGEKINLNLIGVSRGCMSVCKVVKKIQANKELRECVEVVLDLRDPVPGNTRIGVNKWNPFSYCTVTNEVKDLSDCFIIKKAAVTVMSGSDGESGLWKKVTNLAYNVLIPTFPNTTEVELDVLNGCHMAQEEGGEVCFLGIEKAKELILEHGANFDVNSEVNKKNIKTLRKKQVGRYNELVAEFLNKEKLTKIRKVHFGGQIMSIMESSKEDYQGTFAPDDTDKKEIKRHKEAQRLESANKLKLWGLNCGTGEIKYPNPVNDKRYWHYSNKTTGDRKRLYLNDRHWNLDKQTKENKKQEKSLDKQIKENKEQEKSCEVSLWVKLPKNMSAKHAFDCIHAEGNSKISEDRQNFKDNVFSSIDVKHTEIQNHIDTIKIDNAIKSDNIKKNEFVLATRELQHILVKNIYQKSDQAWKKNDISFTLNEHHEYKQLEALENVLSCICDHDKLPKDKLAALTTYETQAKQNVSTWAVLGKYITKFLILATAMVVGAVVGVGIAVLATSWTGPGAIVAAISAGYVGAKISTAATAAAIGVTAGGGAGFVGTLTFFSRKNKFKEANTHFSKTAEDYIKSSNPGNMLL